MSNRINTISFNIDIAPKAHDMGRNLLRGAGLASLDSITDGGITLYHINSMSASLVKIVDGVDGNKGVWAKTNSGETNVYRGVFFTAAVNKGETYTLSAWVKGTAGQTLTLEVINSTGTARKNSDGTDGTRYTGAESVAEIADGWKRVSHTFTVDDKNAGYIECDFFTNAVGEYTISEPKLERGDSATAFCLNEADLKGEKGDKGDQGIQGLQGLQGEKGDQGIKGEQGDAATVYTIEAVDNSNNSGTLKDASTIAVTLIGKLKLYKTVGSEKTEVSRSPQCWRLTVGGTNVDGTSAFTNTGDNISYSYTQDYPISSDGNSAVPGSATVSVYKDNTMSELLASIVIPITLNPNAIVDVNTKLGKITNTTTSMQRSIETIEQGQGKISLKVAGLGLRNLLMDSEFRCPVEKTIKRGGKKYREAWNNGTSVTVTDTANGISAEGVNAVKAISAVSDGDWTVTRWYVPAKSGQVYTASAWCMVPDVSVLTGDSCCYLQLFACKDDLSRSNDSKAYAYFKGLSSGEWKRDTCSLTMPQDTTYTYIEVALAAFKCGTVYFRKPQLEYGGEATEWTRCADDVEGGLLATGIDIENGTVKMTGQNFQWQNTRGVRVLYMDDNGNATFKGKVTASAIEGSSVTGGTITGAKIVSENAGDGTRTTIEGGKLTTKGAEMENVTIGAGSVNYGTNRQPFAYWDVWNNDTNISDNLILPAEKTQSIFTFPIPWEYECNGRVITLVNYKIAYNNSSHYPIDYSARIVAPSGKFFFEDGIAKGSITVGREIVRIMGYGSSIDYNGTTYKEFYGWVVLSREPIGESLMRGEHQRIIYQGVYDGNLRYKAFNGASLSAKKEADGYFTISFGKPFASVNDYEVIVSARDLSNSTKGYACVISKNTGSFKVVTAYKGAPYNGGFTFQVIPAWDWS